MWTVVPRVSLNHIGKMVKLPKPDYLQEDSQSVYGKIFTPMEENLRKQFTRMIQTSL